VNDSPAATAAFADARPRGARPRLWIHAGLFIATFLTATMAGSWFWEGTFDFGASWPVLVDVSRLAHGVTYAWLLLLILGAHEMGHYLLCRRHDVDASLPYFIPVPLFLTGTLGAVIRIREAFPTRRVLFDIGVAGPIAGFLVLVPALFVGLSLSTVVPQPSQKEGLLMLGEPLLFRWAMQAVVGTVPSHSTINMHPMVFASWFGMLATFWNLMPFGQFDGGHLAYATIGRPSKWLSLVTVAVAVVLVYFSMISWLVMTVVMLVMLKLFGASHPPVLNDYEPLPPSRYVLALVAILILVLCFMPVPFQEYKL
jgi:membrane-associated protease RseP (regulator of RpoE activity)